MRRFYRKALIVSDTHKIREDPFKEICSLQWLQEVPQAAGLFPGVLAVLEDENDLVKVEQDCSAALLEFVLPSAERSAVRIPENWVVHILSQLVQGLHVLHSLGFVHLDLSLENCMCDTRTGAAWGDLHMVRVCCWDLTLSFCLSNSFAQVVRASSTWGSSPAFREISRQANR